MEKTPRFKLIFQKECKILENHVHELNTYKTVIEEKGQRLMENYYSCLFQGPFIISRLRFPDTIGHPTAEDLSNARKWANEIVKSISDF